MLGFALIKVLTGSEKNIKKRVSVTGIKPTIKNLVFDSNKIYSLDSNKIRIYFTAASLKDLEAQIEKGVLGHKRKSFKPQHLMDAASSSSGLSELMLETEAPKPKKLKSTDIGGKSKLAGGNISKKQDNVNKFAAVLGWLPSKLMCAIENKPITNDNKSPSKSPSTIALKEKNRTKEKENKTPDHDLTRTKSAQQIGSQKSLKEVPNNTTTETRDKEKKNGHYLDKTDCLKKEIEDLKKNLEKTNKKLKTLKEDYDNLHKKFLDKEKLNEQLQKKIIEKFTLIL